MTTSIFSRKRDLAYLVYFCISVPVTFLMDLQAIYPAHLVPTFMTKISSFYIETYNDLFFINHPPFFQIFIWSELFYQFPTGIWAISNLLKDSPKVPLVLLPFSIVIFLTTGTLIFEYMHWDVPLQQKIDMTTLYGPYLLLSMFMGIDMYLRLNTIINKATSNSGTVSKKKEL